MTTPKKHHEPRKCKNPNCGKIFIPQRDDKEFCSPACYNAWYQRTKIRESKPKPAMNLDPKRGLHKIKCEICGKMFMPASRTHKVCLKCRREQSDYKQKRLKAEQQKKQREAKQKCDELKMKSWAKLLNIDYHQNYGKIRAYYILNKYSELKKRAPYLVPARITT